MILIKGADEAVKIKKIKCVVWDLDNTLWKGILLEDETIVLRSGIERIIRTLDKRGILQSIASRNEPEMAMEMLRLFRLDPYFLHPQINWSEKPLSIRTIAESLNIGLDTLCFIDDDPFERHQVLFALPDVLVVDSADVYKLLDMPRLEPEYITPDSARRREMYLEDMSRARAESVYSGTKEDFLATLKMELTVFPAKKSDLQRALELTERTNQLNTTGYTYSYAELDAFLQSDRHLLLMAALTDTYGSYGRIGLALVETKDRIWTLKLLLMSCRTLSRGVGAVFLNQIRRKANENGVRLLAEFLPTPRNRMMEITFRLSGFKPVEKKDGLLFESPEGPVPPHPSYLKVKYHE